MEETCDCEVCHLKETCINEPILNYFKSSKDFKEEERIKEEFVELLSLDSVWMQRILQISTNDLFSIEEIFLFILLTGYIIGKGALIPESLLEKKRIIKSITAKTEFPLNPSLN